MKAVDKAKRLASHICIICSTAILVIQILDWYNPFMDFMGNSRFLLYGLCIAAMFLGICEICRKKDDKGRRRKYAGSKHESIFSKERYGIFPDYRRHMEMIRRELKGKVEACMDGRDEAQI